MTQAIVFDCFGVILTDAMQLVRNELAQKDPVAAQEASDVIAANNRGLLQPVDTNLRLAELLGVTPDQLRHMVSGREVRDQALLDYILTLRARYKTALLSNIAGSSLQRRFPDDELYTYFDVVVASGDIGYAKPEARAYEIVAEKLGVLPSACVFIDDREAFCDAAETVGMRGLVYTNFAQLQADLTVLLGGDRA
jgi:HAD superfamily hydrolase (TIGR01509 family)